MWNVIASNRVLDMKWKKQNQRKHLKNLKNIKGQVNNSAPKQYNFLYSRPKARQLLLEKSSQIQNHNTFLMKRMLSASSGIGKNETFFKESLNSPYTRKMSREIDEDNKNLVKRLQCANSQYSQKGMKRHVQNYYSVRSKIALQKTAPFYDLSTPNFLHRPQSNRKTRPFSAKD